MAESQTEPYPRPWLDQGLHACQGRAKPKYFLRPVAGRKSMVVTCSLCPKKWPHPGGEDLHAAWVAGYRACRKNIVDASDQMAASLVGLVP